MDGLILVDKPRGATSHDVVDKIREILGVQRVGHFGTLDPLATGLLLVAVGKATKLFPFFSKEDKLYQGRIRLGFATDTYDALGRPTSEESHALPVREVLQEAMKKFLGQIGQVPPLYSAKKLAGRPLYKWAKAKRSFSLQPVSVSVYSFEVIEFKPPYLDMEVSCSSGTYIRSLAHELGQNLGCGAHLAELRRIEVGRYTISAAFSLAEIARLAHDGDIQKFLLPLEALLQELTKVILDLPGEQGLQKGKIVASGQVMKILEIEARAVPVRHGESAFRLFSREGKFLALAHRDKNARGFIPFLLLR